MLLASDGTANDLLGWDPCLNDDLLIVGAPRDDQNGLFSGSVYVFQRDGAGMFAESQKLVPNDPRVNGFFGNSVAAFGDVVVIGAPGNGGAVAGAVYVFERTGQNPWVQTAKLIAPLGSRPDYFGFSVALNEDNLIVGAPREMQGQAVTGGAHVYQRDGGGNWVHVETLLADDGEHDDGFGSFSALSGDTIVFEAVRESSFGIRSGAAYVFRNDGSGHWTQEARLLASDGQAEAEFGRPGIDGETIVIGAGYHDAGGIEDSGAAYVFQRDVNGDWIETAKLSASDASIDDRFGYGISINSGVIAVGADLHDDLGQNAGTVYLFREDDSGQWIEDAQLFALNGAAGDEFGIFVEADDQTLAVSAVTRDSGVSNTGAVYVFDLNCDTALPATLTDFSIAFGTLVSGALQDLVDSDDAWVRARSRFGFTAQEPNVMDLHVGAVTAVQDAQSLDLAVEGRLSQSGGTSKLRLRNWTTNGFEQVHQYSIGTTEIIESIDNVPAANRVRTSDGRIEISIRQSVVTTFTVMGFDSFTDQVAISVR